jgi:hypothetical protein
VTRSIRRRGEPAQMTSMSFWNLTRRTTFGNWFSPFNEVHRQSALHGLTLKFGRGPSRGPRPCRRQLDRRNARAPLLPFVGPYHDADSEHRAAPCMSDIACWLGSRLHFGPRRSAQKASRVDNIPSQRFTRLPPYEIVVASSVAPKALEDGAQVFLLGAHKTGADQPVRMVVHWRVVLRGVVGGFCCGGFGRKVFLGVVLTYDWDGCDKDRMAARFFSSMGGARLGLGWFDGVE